MDMTYVVFSVFICIYIAYLFLRLSDKFLEENEKYYLTWAWIFRKDILSPDGQVIRSKILASMFTLIVLSILYFWL